MMEDASEFYLSAISDTRVEIETFYTSWAGIIITTISSSISVVASFLVIFVVMASPRRLSTVYHRILFGTSIFDIMQSSAMAFTTLPMPSNMIYDQFQGLIAGDDTSCSAQGFLISFGTTTGLSFNVILLLYYVFSMRYNRNDQWFKNHLEIPLYVFVLVVNFSQTVVAWQSGAYHPSPVASPWCSLYPYPWWCSENDATCPQSMTQAMKFFTVFLLTVMAPITFITISISVVLIIRTVHTHTRDFLSHFDTRRLQAENEEDSEVSGSEQQPSLRPSNQTSSLRNSSANGNSGVNHNILETKRYLLKQALAYSIINVFNFIILAIFPPIRNHLLRESFSLPVWLQVFYVIFRPLQGFFNFLIFIHHKIFNLRRSRGSNLSFFDAFVLSLKGQEPPERIIHELTLVREHHEMQARSMGNNDGNDDFGVTTSCENDSKMQEQSNNIPEDSFSSLSISQESNNYGRHMIRTSVMVRSQMGNAHQQMGGHHSSPSRIKSGESSNLETNSQELPGYIMSKPMSFDELLQLTQDAKSRTDEASHPNTYP